MLLTNAYDPDPRVREEALALLAMGCRVRLLAWDRDLKAAASECVEGVEVDRVFLRSAHGRGNTQVFFYAWLYLKMLWKGWRIHFDVVHCHDLDTFPLGFLLGKLKRRPIVYDAHESFPDMVANSIHPVMRGALVWLEDFLIRRCSLLITVGEKLRSYFESRGVRHSVVVGNWKRLDEYDRSPEQNRQLRQYLSIPEGSLVIVCITQLLKDRKIEELLEAVDRCPAVYLVLAGKGALEPLVAQWAAKNPRVRYVGFVRGEQIPAYTCAADIVYYGFDPVNPNARFIAPNKLFEALAAGRPLITGDFGEIGEVVRQTGCGIVLPEYSVERICTAMECMRDIDLRSEMEARARNYGRTVMNWKKGEQILYQEYSALLSVPLSWPPARAAAGQLQ